MTLKAPSIDSILWRSLTAGEVAAVARAKSAMHLAVEHLFSPVIAHAIRECERHDLQPEGLVFHRAIAQDLASMIGTTLIRLLNDSEHRHAA